MESKLDLALVRGALASTASAGFRSSAPLARESEAKVGKIGANLAREPLSQAMVGKNPVVFERLSFAMVGKGGQNP